MVGYDGFISYSHAADGRFAPALQLGLQRLAKPWNHRRALNIFRDETGLSTNPHLWSAIETALNDSEWFLLLASPEAAESEWVGKELHHWLATKSAERILPVVTDGTWTWDPAGRVDGTAVPAALRDAFGDEPRHLDLRWARDETDLDLRNSRFRSAVADLAAPLHGLPKDELEGEDIRQHRRARRLARGAVIGLVLLVLVALGATGVAVAQRNSARRSENEAVAGRIAALANNFTSRRLDLALLLGVEASRRLDSSDTRDALQRAVVTSPSLVRFVPMGGASIVVAHLDADEKSVTVGYRDGTVRRFDLEGHQLRGVLRAHRGPVSDARVSPNGRVLATAGESDGTVRLWDARSLHPLAAPLDAGARGTDSLAFRPDGTMLAAGGNDNRVRRWSIPAGTPIGNPTTLSSGLNGLGCLAFSPDGALIAVPDVNEGSAGRIVLLNATTGAPNGPPIPLGEPAATVAFSPDGALLAAGEGSGVVIASVADRRVLGTPMTDRAAPQVNDVGFSRDGRRLVSAAHDGAVTVWDVASRQLAAGPFLGHGGPVWNAAFTQGTEQVISFAATGAALWNTSSALSLGVAVVVGPAPGVSDTGIDLGTRVTPIGERVAFARVDGRVALIDPRRPRRFRLLPTGAPHVSELAASADGSSLVALVGEYSPTDGAWSDQRLVVWDLPSERRVASWPLDHDEPSFSLAVAGASKRIVACCDVNDHGSMAELRDRFGRVVATLAVDSVVGEASAFSPDGRLLATAGNDGIVRLWSATDGEPRGALPAREGGVRGLAFSPDGALLASAGEDGNVVVVNVASRVPLGWAPSTSDGQIDEVAFSPDGRWLATSSRTGISLWDVEHQQAIGASFPKRSGAQGLGFAGGEIVTAVDDRTLGLTTLDPAQWRHRACQLAGGNLTPAQWDQYVGGSYRQTCPVRP